VRQAVLAARELEPVAGQLRDQLDLGEPFADPGVEYFGLRNAVFALGDTFLEVVSPTRQDTPAGRLLDRRGGDCGYMVMFQVGDLSAARERAAAQGVREVFEVELDDIGEVHLHPADIRGAIVAVSSPRPPASWRWGGPDWSQRSVPLRIAGVTLGVSHPEAVAERWGGVLGARAQDSGAHFTQDESERGLTEIALRTQAAADREPLEIGGVRFVFQDSEEDR
jgi:hypothetical protein